MNHQTDFDQLARTWLEDGPATMSDRSLQAALDEVHVTSQQRFGAARRTFDMQGIGLRLAAASLVGVLIIVAGGLYLRNNPSGGVGGPGATPTPTIAPTPAPTPSPSLAPVGPSPTPVVTTGWVPLSSDRFGSDMAIPPTWTATPATQDWSHAIDDEATPGADVLVDQNVADQLAVQAFSTTVPAGMSNTDWIASVTGPYGGCTPLPIGLWETITVDGHPAMFDADACDASQAFVFIGDRVYRFSVWRGDQQPLLKAFLSTVHFHPVVGASASPSARPSATP